MNRRAFVLFASLLLVLVATATHAFSATHLWSMRFGDNVGQDIGRSVAVDASGNVFVTGYFIGTASFGGGNITSLGVQDIFVAKYNAAGVYQWAGNIGGTGFDVGNSVAVDPSGAVVVTGSFSNTVNFGGGPLVSAGFYDIFVAKYSPTGAHQWSQRFGGSTSNDSGSSVAIDASGNVLVTGYFGGTANFGGGNLVSAGGGDIFVAKYSATGVHQWSQHFGSTGSDFASSVAVDASGNAFVTGYFNGTVNFGGGNRVSVGGNDIFIAKYSATGVHQWSQGFGSMNSDAGNSVAADTSGNVLVTGTFTNTVDFGGGNRVSAGADDIFVAKYSAVGVHQWSQSFGNINNDAGNSVVTEGSGNVLVTGFFKGAVDFGGGNLVSVGISGDIFVANYDDTGVHQWSQRYGELNAAGNCVATDAPGNVLLTGAFSGVLNFGGSVLFSSSTDIFLAKLSPDPDQPLIESIADIGNDQGRQVRIRFKRSGHDDPGSPVAVTSYEAYRRDDPPPAPLPTGSVVSGRSPGALLADGWTFVGLIPLHGEKTYGIDVPTVGDSTAAQGQYYSVFYIRAATDDPFTFYDSPIDSGYSLDNLVPGVPLNFVYNAGQLTWDASSAADFDYFTVYGSNTDSFGAATVVDYSVAPAMNVSTSPYTFYFVTATDFSGNEGMAARLNTLSGVGGTPKSYVLSVSNYPNPFNPRTTVSYTVPSRGRVTVSIYDARGARVATLVNGEDRAAGAYRIEWNGRAEGGDLVSSGVYFTRIEQAGNTRTRKMLLLK